MKMKIVNGIQFFILVFMMIMGFWLTYGLLCSAIGLPLNNAAMLVVTVISLLSETIFLIWVVHT